MMHGGRPSLLAFLFLSVAAGSTGVLGTEGYREHAPSGLPAARAADEPARAPQQDEPGRTVTSRILTVKLAFKAQPQLFPYTLEVEEENGGLRLAGTVGTEEERRLAEKVAAEVTGNASIANHLAVDSALRRRLGERQDQLITTYVKAAFAKSTTLDTANFQVTTQDGIVALQGATRFQVLLLEAAEAAQRVPGVRAVNTEKVRLSASD